MTFQIFSYFANYAIEVSLIAVFVNNTIGELELIAVKITQLTRLQLLQANVQVQQRKEADVKTKQLIQMGVAIYIDFQ